MQTVDDKTITIEQIAEKVNKDIPLGNRRFVCYWDNAFVDGESVKVQSFRAFVLLFYEELYTHENLINIARLSSIGDVAIFYENPYSMVGLHTVQRIK